MGAPELLTVTLGGPRYEDVLGPIRGDARLRRQMWADAGHRLDERPGKIWCAALIAGRPVAWAAACVDLVDGARVLVCSDSYEVRGPGRAGGWYAAAYELRHREVVATSALPAVTYLYRQPLARHEADGWQRTGPTGVTWHGWRPHRWWQLRREPTG